jgi:hypothetical protein
MREKIMKITTLKALLFGTIMAPLALLAMHKEPQTAITPSVDTQSEEEEANLLNELLAAIKAGDTEKAKSLIPKIDLQQYAGVAPVNALYVAVVHDRPEIVKMLIDKGLNPHRNIYRAGSPFMKAINHHRLRVLEVMLNSGKVDQEQKAKGLKEAIAAGYNDVANLLLEHGAGK